MAKTLLFIMSFVSLVANTKMQIPPDTFTPDNSFEASSMEIDSSSVSPKPARSSSIRCRMQINELYLGEINDDVPEQFIELKRFCPPNNNLEKVQHGLDGYMIIAVELTEEPKILLILKYVNQALQEVEGEWLHVSGTSNVTEKILTLGPTPIHRQRPVGSNMQYTSFPDNFNILPKGNSETTVAIFLLYFKYNERKKYPYNSCKLDYRITPDTREIHYPDGKVRQVHVECIQDHVVDYVLYGRDTEESPKLFMKEVLKQDNFNTAIQLLMFPTDDENAKYSFSRCTDTSMDGKAFDLAAPTPLRRNACMESEGRAVFEFPFKFYGHGIQTAAQKVILNLVHFLKYHTKELNQTTNTAKLVEKMIGLHHHTIYSIINRHKQGPLATPGRKRKRVSKVREQVDSFDRNHLRTIIAGFYENGRAPILADIYDSFLRYKREGTINFTTSAAGSVPQRWQPLAVEPDNNIDLPMPSCPGTPVRHSVNYGEGFYISQKTFSKILHEMGFKFGRLNNRLVLIMRPDILMLRGRFLTGLRRNAARTQPFKVTYLDETWIDPNQVTSKGWTLKRPTSFRESSKYSLPAKKQGHGPRIIALAAGDDNGIIPESVDVYKIQRNTEKLDYHENVNKEKFMHWFKNLLSLWKRNNERHIIVMDNAPYHSSMKAPKQSDRKAVLYEWLESIKNNPNLNMSFHLDKKMLKWQLYELVQQFKKKPELQKEVYEIDNLAAKEGHEVLRLPPYMCELNPIEFAWSVVKRRVARENSKQNVDDVVTIATNVLLNYNQSVWKNQVQHCLRLGEKYWKEDGFMDIEIEPLIIPINDEDDTDDDDSDEETNHCSHSERSLHGGVDPPDLEASWANIIEGTNSFIESNEATTADYGSRNHRRVRLFE